MAEEAKPIRELFNLGPSHYGPVPTKANPYLHVCLITKTYIREVFEKKLTRCIACPVTIKLKGKYQDISEALSGLPPSVSSTELTQRFKVDVLKDVSIPLTSFFKPALHLLEGNELTNLINELHKDIVFMCTMATQHHMDAANNSQSNHMEISNEQRLFSFLLKGLMDTPCITYEQCVTKQEPATGPLYLPSAKFDLMVCHTDDGPNDSTILVQVNETSEENSDLMVKNEVNSTINLEKLDVSIALESLIYSEINKHDCTRIIAATQSFVRPVMRMKSTDLLFTTPTVLQWCKEKDGGLEFDLAGCMLFLLFVRAGSGFYPEYDASEIPDLMDVQRYVCGWNEGYAQVPTKYSRTLKQRSPVLPTPNRGAKLPTGSCLFYGDSVNMGDHVQTLKSRKRRRSS